MTSVPSDRPSRSPTVDALRGIALLGIIIVNAPFFAGPEAGLPIATPLDVLAAWAVWALLAGKVFLVFSFLFGFGFATMLRNRERTPGFGARFARRLGGLFAFGVLHACFLFFGDILMLYALLGCVLWLCRDWPRARLTTTAAWVYALGAVLQVAALLTSFGQLQASPGPIPAAGAGYLGGFLDVTAARLAELPGVLGFILLFNGLPALAMFLLGLAMGRDGSFPPTPETLRRHRRRNLAALAAGAAVSGVATALAMSGSARQAGLALVALAVATPVLSYGLAGTVLGWLSRRPEATVVAWLATLGSSSLTGYILHSVLLGAVFYGWGLGLYGSQGPAAVLVISVAVFVAVLASVNAWRRLFLLGPDEWLLRSFVDLRWRPLRR